MKHHAALLLILALGLSACSSKNDNEKIGDAQFCLDDAEADDAKKCVEGIEGIESKQASYLRCAAGFLAEGFGDPATLSNLKTQIDSAGDNKMALLGILAFKSAGADSAKNQANAQATLEECKKAGSSILVNFATIATLSSVLAGQADIDWSNPANTTPEAAAALLDAVAANPTPETKEAIGNAVISAYSGQCAGKDTDDCKKINEAITAAGGTGNSEAVGQKALCAYKPTLPGC